MDEDEKTPERPVDKSSSGESAFDVWLERGLHQLFDEIAQEPIPEGLLKLIEADRKK